MMDEEAPPHPFQQYRRWLFDAVRGLPFNLVLARGCVGKNPRGTGRSTISIVEKAISAALPSSRGSDHTHALVGPECNDTHTNM